MPNRYPQEAILRDGRGVLIRPFEQKDVEALHEFFLRLTEKARRFAWDRIDDRNLIESWGRNIDYSKAFPLLAFEGHKVVADATLHRREGGPLRRVGRVRWLIDPEYQGVGLGTLLINHFINIAKTNGLSHLTCMLISDVEADAVRVLQHLGFDSYVVPGYGTDPDGNQHDMTKLVLRI